MAPIYVADYNPLELASHNSQGYSSTAATTGHKITSALLLSVVLISCLYWWATLPQVKWKNWWYQSHSRVRAWEYSQADAICTMLFTQKLCENSAGEKDAIQTVLHVWHKDDTTLMLVSSKKQQFIDNGRESGIHVFGEICNDSQVQRVPKQLELLWAIILAQVFSCVTSI